MDTKYSEGKQRQLNVGRMIATLLTDEAFVYLRERLDLKVKEAKDALELSEAWDDFTERRGYLKGLSALTTEIDTIIQKMKNAERTLKQ